MSTAERSFDLVKAIAKAYVKNTTKSESIDTHVNINNSIIIATSNSPVCSDCLHLFFDNNVLADPDVQKNLIVTQVRQGSCSYACVTTSEIYQKNNVIFDLNLTINVQQIFEDVQLNLAKYDNNFTLDINDIEKVLDTIRLETVINVNQSVSSVSLIHIDQGATLRNVNTDLFVDAVMNTIIKNENTISDMVHKSIVKMQNDIRSKVTQTFAEIWEKEKNNFIVIGVILGCTLLLMIILLVSKFLKVQIPVETSMKYNI